MVVINEWLPNPFGSDEDGEWIEILNSGGEKINLSGLYVENKKGQKYFLKGELEGNKFLVLKRKETRIVLTNQDEKISLYDAKNNLVEGSGFFGEAPEGKSFSRASSDHFVFLDPTPGLPNGKEELLTSAAALYPIGKPLNVNPGPSDFLLMLFGAAGFLTALVIFILKSNESR
ncbi:MAG: lamin tail domain-containing protein [Candidatus Liptonbacteria bacterium]|nr:lamin tail domain-containing protein [Candidatus Liptonbacteria bacterium]